MDRNQLLSSTVEMGLELLEKNGDFLPFCKAVSESGEALFFTPDSNREYTVEQAYVSVRNSVEADLQQGNLKGVAFCCHSNIRLEVGGESIPAIQIELHYRDVPAENWYFVYEIIDNQADILEYYTSDASEDLFA